MGDGEGGHWLVRMECRPARWSVCLPLLIFSCTIKSRSSLLALAHLGGPGKRAIKWLWCGDINYYYKVLKWVQIEFKYYRSLQCAKFAELLVLHVAFWCSQQVSDFLFYLLAHFIHSSASLLTILYRFSPQYHSPYLVFPYLLFACLLFFLLKHPLIMVFYIFWFAGLNRTDRTARVNLFWPWTLDGLSMTL